MSKERWQKISEWLETGNMTWTTKLPDRNGWYWFRHISGSIPSHYCVQAIIFRHPVKRRGKWHYRYDSRPHVTWRGKNVDVKKMPTGWNFRWSSRPIRMPNRETASQEAK